MVKCRAENNGDEDPDIYFDLNDQAGLDADGNFESNTTWSKNRHGTKNPDAIE